MSDNGFTKISNALWDRTDLNSYERLVLLHIMRKTIGWGKTKDWITFGQFKEVISISRNTLIKATKGLTSKKLIKETKSKCGRFTTYSVVAAVGKGFTELPNALWDREDLNNYERLFLIHVLRKTTGWGKASDGISTAKFLDTLQISKSTFLKTKKGLVLRHLIYYQPRWLATGSRGAEIYSFEPIQQPEIVQKPEPEPEIIQQPMQKPEPEIIQQAQPEPEIIQQAQPEPEIIKKPEPEPEIIQQPEPEIIQQPEPEPEIIQQPEPEIIQQPEPEPQPIQKPQPQPIQKPEPEPEIIKKPEPQPIQKRKTVFDLDRERCEIQDEKVALERRELEIAQQAEPIPDISYQQKELEQLVLEHERLRQEKFKKEAMDDAEMERSPLFSADDIKDSRLQRQRKTEAELYREGEIERETRVLLERQESESKTRELRSIDFQHPQESFAVFWSLYLKKVNENEVKRAWVSIDSNTANEVIFALKMKPNPGNWGKSNWQYMPDPANFIRDRRWLDDVPPCNNGGADYKYVDYLRGSGSPGYVKYGSSIVGECKVVKDSDDKRID